MGGRVVSVRGGAQRAWMVVLGGMLHASVRVREDGKMPIQESRGGGGGDGVVERPLKEW